MLTRAELDAAKYVAENTDLFDSELMSVGLALEIIAQAALAADLEEDKAALVDALRDGTKDALDVAAAVTWCEKNANLVEYRPLKGWLVDDGWHNEMQAGLPAAVAALRERAEKGRDA